MKQILLSLAILAWMAPEAIAQRESLNEFIDKQKGNKAFTYAYLSKDLFEVAAKSSIEDKDWRKLHQVVRNIGSLSILAADSIDNALDFYREAFGYISSSDVEALLTVQDGKDRVRIWVKEADGVVSELILLVGTSNEFVLVCFAGNLELGNITELAALLDADEAVSLAKTSKAVALDFKVFPNPTSGEFALEYPDMTDKPALLSIFDQNGHLLSTLNITNNEIRQFIPRDYPAGTYWFQLKTESGQVGIIPVQFVKN